MYDIVIGIDPDSERDGIAILYPATRQISAQMTTFGRTLNIIQQTYIQALSTQKSFIVYVEAGWLNKGNFHIRPYDSKYKIAALGVDQGRNHQRGLDIIDYCEYNKIPYKEVKPLPKTASGFHLWNGKDGKITQPEIEAIMGKLGRLNQEGRDAALIAWWQAGLPLSSPNF